MKDLRLNKCETSHRFVDVIQCADNVWLHCELDYSNMLHKTGGGQNEGARSSANVGVQDGIILKLYVRQVEW